MRANITLPHPLVSFTFLICVCSYQYLVWPLMMVNDVPRHLAAGNYILNHGIPASDPWSFTAGDTPWYNLAWGWDVLMALCLKYAGELATRGIIVLIPAFTIALVVQSLIRRKTISEEAVIFTILTIGIGLSDFISARPQTFSFLMIVLFQQILHASRDAARYGGLLWLPALTLCWVNMHGSIPVAVTLLGAYGLEAILNRKHQWLKRLLVVSFACAAAALVNPYGIHVIDGIFRTSTTITRNFIMEWKPFTLGANGPSFWFLIFIFISNFKDENIPFADRIISFAWLIAALLSARNISVFIVVSIPYFAYHMHALCHRLSRVTKTTPKVPEYPRHIAASAFAITLVISFLAVFTPAAYLIKSKEEMAFIPRMKDTVEFVAAHYPDERFLNAYELGSYIIWLDKHIPVFIDDRAETAYPEAVIKDYFEFLTAENGWEDIFNRYKLKGLIMPSKESWSKLVAKHQFNGTWKKTFEGEDTAVYLYCPALEMRKDCQ